MLRAARRHTFLKAMLVASTAYLSTGGALWAQQVEDKAATFNLPAQSLTSSLTQLARQAGIKIAYPAALTSGKSAPALRGAYKRADALEKLLEGSGLTYQFTSAGSVRIMSRSDVSEQGAMVPSDGQVLDPIIVIGKSETATGPVKGYVATRSGAGTKTDTPIIETPQSVSVVTADQIKDQKAGSLVDALAYTPGVSAQSQSFSRMADDIMIRGFNSSSTDGSMMRDGMKYQSNVYDGSQEPYGLERLDILRGASSMLYGALTPGGAINAVSKRPTDTPLHEINLEYGSYDRKQASGDFSGALDKDGTLLYRLTGLVRDADNWVDDIPDDKVYIAPALTWRPSDKTELTALSNYQYVDTRFATPLMLGDVASDRIPRDEFLGNTDFDTYQSETYSLGYLLDHEFDNGVKLHHKARYFEADVQWDYMQANFAPVTNGQIMTRASARDEKSYGFVTDTALEKSFQIFDATHTVLAGFDYYRRSYDTHRYRGTFIPVDVDNPSYDGKPVINYGTDFGWDATGNQYGIYLQDQIKFHNWVALLGARHDWADSETDTYRTGVVTRQDDKAFTGRAGVVYLFDNGVAPYVSISQSFLPQSGLDSKTNEPLEPNKGLQYEAGIRYQPQDSNLLLSAAVYELTQTNLVSYDAVGAAYQLGKVRSRGLELEARAQFDDLGLVGAYAYTHAEIIESAVPAQEGEQVELVPRHMFSLWADYRMDSLGLKGLTLGGGGRYIGETNLLDSDRDVPDYFLVDAMARYDFGVIDERLEGTSVTLNARNLFDKEFYTCAGASGCRYGEPLTVTATLTKRW
jgi:iron complex outermembrane recepter protein